MSKLVKFKDSILENTSHALAHFLHYSKKNSHDRVT